MSQLLKTEQDMRENQPSSATHSLRVLHIGKYFPPYPGGMETYLRDLMVAQTKQGLESTALVHQSALSLRSSTEQYPAGEQTLSVTRAAVWLRLLFAPISPSFPWLLNRLIKEKRPDLLHLHMPNLSVFWALLMPSARRIPWVVQWQSDVLASEHRLGLRLFYALYKPFESAVLRRSTKIIASSPPYLKSSATLAAFRDKCVVIPLGIRPNTRVQESCSMAESVDGQPLRILAIGRLTYYKGFQYLVSAMAKVPEARLDLVGSGEEQPRLEKLMSELDLTDRVQIHNGVSDEQLEHFIAKADCLCLPSVERTEAFGIVLLEAMSHAKPTVISRVAGSGMAWVVEDGVTGLQVPAADACALAISLTTLQHNRDKLQQLGHNGRLRFNRHFHIEKSAAGVTHLYQQVRWRQTQNRQ
ncbi:glycosyltransferase [Luminiphilus sp.]|nr:glycosyltransferase [Luminiphilus sp.]